MTDANETWTPVLNYERQYECSTLGNVRRICATHNLVPVLTHRGYGRLTLCKTNGRKTITIHRIILSSFSKENKSLEINHKDGDKTNNALDNLEWCSRSENAAHAKRTGLYEYKLNQELVDQIKLTKLETELSNRELGKVFGLSHPTIGEALKK